MTDEQRRLTGVLIMSVKDALAAAQSIAARGCEALEGTEGYVVLNNLCQAIGEFSASSPAMREAQRVRNEMHITAPKRA